MNDDEREDARRHALHLIEAERSNQPYTNNFDKLNTQNDWGLYMAAYASRVFAESVTSDAAVVCFIKVGALAVAAIESYLNNGGYNPRAWEGHPECRKEGDKGVR